MSLPQVAPYALPTEDELPANRVDWRPDRGRALLLVHDMQRHFLAIFDPAREPIPELVANITALRERCRQLQIPVVFSAQPGGQTRDQRGLLQDFWGDGVAAGASPEEIIDELAPGDGDLRVTKWRYSAFVRTDLMQRLRENGRDQVIVCGIYAHIGCLTTACHAFMQDLETFFVADAVADFSADDHRMAVSWAARTCAVATSTASVLHALAPPAGDVLDREALRADLVGALEEPPAVLDDDDDLVDLGLDSIALMGLITEWRARGADVSFEDLAEVEPTLGAWWMVVQATRGRAPVA